MQALFGRSKKSSNASQQQDNTHAKKKGASLPGIQLKPPLESKDSISSNGRPSSASSFAVALGSTASVDMHASTTEELQLSYGYWGIEFARELTTAQVQYVVDLVGRQIKERGLECPMLFSTMALDLTMEGTTSLIRKYLHDQPGFQRAITFEEPHNLCAFLKWALGRVKLPSGAHGFLQFEIYTQWRSFEMQTDYSNLSFIRTHLFHRLPSSVASLLTSLLDLMASAISFSAKNGCTPHKLAALLGPLIFGLCDDQPFEETYTTFIKYKNATEHLILAYIRDQKAAPGVHFPTRLEYFIQSYPNDLPTNLSKPSAHSKTISVARFSRSCRFYSQDLIKSGGSWEVPRSKTWSSLFPLILGPESGLGVKSPTQNQQTAFTPLYKHLLNLRGQEAVEDLRKYRSTSDKDWASFMHAGFAPTAAEKLQFDLRESERTTRRQKHDTLDWSQFSDLGFGGREIYVDTDLTFDSLLSESVETWPEEKKKIYAKLKKTEKELPSFPYDITPAERPSILVDELFPQAWADTLVSSGWAREEIKESNWVLVHWRARPMQMSPDQTIKGDGRTEERWCLLEENVPDEYRQELLDGKMKRKRTLFSKKKTIKPPLSPRQSSTLRSFPLPPREASPPTINQAVFEPDYEGETRLLSLGSADRPASSTVASSAVTSRHTSISSKRQTDPHTSYRNPQYGSSLDTPPLPPGAGRMASSKVAPGLAEATMTSQSPPRRASPARETNGHHALDSYASTPRVSVSDTERASFETSDSVETRTGQYSTSAPSIITEEDEQPRPTYALPSPIEIPASDFMTSNSGQSEPSTPTTVATDGLERTSLETTGDDDGEIWRGSRVINEGEEGPIPQQASEHPTPPLPAKTPTHYSAAPASRQISAAPNARQLSNPIARPAVPPRNADRDSSMPDDSKNSRISGISQSAFSERSMRVSHLVNLYSQAPQTERKNSGPR